MNAPISDEDWDRLINRPRLLRAWDPAQEHSTAAALLSILKFAENGADSFVLPVELSLGEIRHHVQWCQIAANVLETAKQSQDHFYRLEHRIRDLDNHIRKLEGLLMRAGVDPPPKPRMKHRSIDPDNPF